MGPKAGKMKDLATGVDARVGAPGANNALGTIEAMGEGGLDEVLNGLAASLALPAVEVGAVVGYDAFPAG